MPIDRLSICFLLLFAIGCPAKESTPPPPVERTTPIANAPMNLEKPDRAKVELDLAAARDSINKWKQIEGSNPPSLNALELRYHYPSDLEYDPATGTVKSKTYPML